MDREAYRAALAKLGWTQGDAARFFDVDARTGRRWAAGPVPTAVAMILALMLKHPRLTADHIEKLAIDRPVPVEALERNSAIPRFVEADESTGRRWKRGESPIPLAVTMVLAILASHSRIAPDAVRELVGLPPLGLTTRDLLPED